MKKRLISTGAIIICLFILKCSNKSEMDISDYLNISVSVHNNVINKDSSNIIKVDFVNNSNQVLQVRNGYVKLYLTSALSGANKTMYLDINEKRADTEKKPNISLKLDGKQAYSQQIDLSKLLLEGNNTIAKGEYYISLVFETGEKTKTNTLANVIRSNAIEIKVI